jgi:ABC-type multidrug transport system fused ATPase/permease subunit
VRSGDVVVIDAADRDRSARWPLLVVAAALFALAYENGGYGVGARSLSAIVLWWVVVVAVGLGLVPRARLPGAARVVAVLLAAYTAWTLASTLWAPSAERAFEEFDRSSLYLALFLVVSGLGSRRNLRWWLDGLRLSIVAVALAALTSRLFPHLFTAREIGAFLPNAATRLSFPIGYWNALAVFAALGLPLLLASACTERTRVLRAVALAPAPILVAVVYLASSRGGVLALLLGGLVYVAATDRRWAAVGVAGLAAIGSVAAVLVLRSHRVLVDGPLGTASAVHAGRIVAPLLLIVVVLTGLLLVAAERVAQPVPVPSRGLGIALVAAAAVVVLAAVAFSHPIRRFDEFRQIPTANQTAPNFATSHLTSGSGSGRWQFWAAAVREWESAPVIGRGAGSYRFWWAQHASFTYTLQNAHSLYLEVLGELGLVGVLLLLGALAAALIAGVKSIRADVGEHRRSLAAALAVLTAFLVCAGIDWLWQVTAVGAVGVVTLALAASSGDRFEPAPSADRPGWARLALGAGVLLGAWVAICAAAVPWLTASRIAASQASVRHGDLAGALSDAQDARAIQPWAASTYVQLALVAEIQRDLPAAVAWIHRATQRDTKNWATWYVASRIEREIGHPATAVADYRRARSLNIRSPVFTRQGNP